MIKGGPKIIDDNLVVCLDAHDAKSYAGEPTTNFSTNPKFETGTHDSSSGGTWNNWVFSTWNSYNHKIVDVTDAGMIASGFTKALRVTSDGTSNSQHLSNNNWGSNITAGTVFSLSFWGRASASDTTWIYSQWGGTVGYPEFTTEWKYFKFDNITKAASSGSQYPYFRFEYGPPPSGQWFEVTGFQVEAKSYSTPLADTTRSATDGWKDRTTNDHDGSLLNGTNTGVNYYRDGQVIMPVANSYLAFDGSDDHVKIDHSTQLNNAKTWEIWINIDSFPASSTFDSIFSKTWNWNNDGSILLSMIYGSLRFSYGGYWGGVNIEDLSNMSTGTWYQVVGTGEFLGVGAGVRNKGYLNGVYKSVLTDTSAFIPTNANALYLGDGNGGTMNGKIGLFRVYEDILTAAEILSNYNATKNRFT